MPGTRRRGGWVIWFQVQFFEDLLASVPQRLYHFTLPDGAPGFYFSTFFFYSGHPSGDGILYRLLLNLGFPSEEKAPPPTQPGQQRAGHLLDPCLLQPLLIPDQALLGPWDSASRAAPRSFLPPLGPILVLPAAGSSPPASLLSVPTHSPPAARIRLPKGSSHRLPA